MFLRHNVIRCRIVPLEAMVQREASGTYWKNPPGPNSRREEIRVKFQKRALQLEQITRVSQTVARPSLELSRLKV